MRIRKLVPCETMKLMGFTRQDCDKMRDVGMSDAQIYHCSGDSIVSTCLIAIIGQLLPIDETTLIQGIENYVDEIKES